MPLLREKCKGLIVRGKSKSMFVMFVTYVPYDSIGKVQAYIGVLVKFIVQI